MDTMQNLRWRQIFGASFLVAALLAVVALFRLIDQLLGGGL